MPIPAPNLDDRTFNQLLADAKALIRKEGSEWTDLSPHDPGVVLLEAFAYLTETMIYRLNQVPDKVYVELLNLIGVQIQPPTAASVMLKFSIEKERDVPLEIPRGTRVANARSGEDAVVFTTTAPCIIKPGDTSVEVLAVHADLVDGELLGTTSGSAGQVFRVKRPPIIAPSGDALDLVLGIEITDEDELGGARASAREFQGKTYQVFDEVDNFATTTEEQRVYVADRLRGVLSLATAARRREGEEGEGPLSELPRALAYVPPPQREVRAWYRRGGGPTGNVAAGELTVLKDPIPGVEVTNETAAGGGRAAESLENAKIRGPQELYSLRRAVTARDFELLAKRHAGGVARARAFTQSQLWAHALPGTVEVLLVPTIPDKERQAVDELVSEELLLKHESQEVLERVEEALNERRPLGTALHVGWARYKTVSVSARVVAHATEDPVALRDRLLGRLRRTITPLRTEERSDDGWPFGRALHASDVANIILSEPGVSYYSDVTMRVKERPRNVTVLKADPHQPHTWFAASGNVLFRSLNGGDSWEAAARREGQVEHIAINPEVPGLLVTATRSPDNPRRARIHISQDAGENWESAHTIATVNGMAWTERDRVPVLMIATEEGLYELPLAERATPLQVLVDPQNQDLGFLAITSWKGARGGMSLAVAAESTGGVYISNQAGRTGSFRFVGLRGEDVRVCEIQVDGPRQFLWAGVYAIGGMDGKGAFSTEVTEQGRERESLTWNPIAQNDWRGGSCLSLAFRGSYVYAGSHRQGVLELDAKARNATWQYPSLASGLSLREQGRLFHPVQTVAVDAEQGVLMAGGPVGIVRRRLDEAKQSYHSVSEGEFRDSVACPSTWLLCSGEHDLTVEVADASS